MRRDLRIRRTLRFKLQVVDEYRWLQKQKAQGRCCAPIREVAERFGVAEITAALKQPGDVRESEEREESDFMHRC